MAALGLAGEGDAAAAEGFFEFKMRKMQERKMREQQTQEATQQHDQSEQDRRREEEDENDGMSCCYRSPRLQCYRLQ